MKRLFLFLALLTISFVLNAKGIPYKTFIVVLDAGHGGKDPGSIGSTNANKEKDINLAITLEVGRLLEANNKNIKVVYTRNTDVFVELKERARIANKAKADLFVSVHTNAIDRDPNRQPMGVQSYTLSLSTMETNLEVERRENSVLRFEKNGESLLDSLNSAESKMLYEITQENHMVESVRFAKMVQKQMVNYAGRNDMKVQQANLAVLRLTYMPSVLLEVGFISTDAEETFLMSKEGRNKMAMAIYRAIVEYANSIKRT